MNQNVQNKLLCVPGRVYYLQVRTEPTGVEHLYNETDVASNTSIWILTIIFKTPNIETIYNQY
jgi:hypothetical protein